MSAATQQDIVIIVYVRNISKKFILLVSALSYFVQLNQINIEKIK